MVVYSIPWLLMPFSSTKTMFSSCESVGFNSYRSRFEPLPSSGMASPTLLLLPPGVERLQWKTTKIIMTAITTTAPHVTPIINGRLDDLLDPSSLFPPAEDNNNWVEYKLHSSEKMQLKVVLLLLFFFTMI